MGVNVGEKRFACGIYIKKILQLHKNSHIFPVGKEWKLLFFQRRQLYDQQAYENMFSIISYHRYTNTKIKWSVTFTSNKMTILKKTEKKTTIGK